jgi:hypothetical protein
MNRFIIMSILLTVCFFPGCQRKTKEPSQVSAAAPAATVPIELKKIDFVPPADSSMTIDQVKKITTCNPLLDSLSIFYKDSFKTKDAALLIRLQDDFSKAQDKICLRAGLAGGYKEYFWIFKNLGLPRNARLLDSLKMTVY